MFRSQKKKVVGKVSVKPQDDTRYSTTLVAGVDPPAMQISAQAKPALPDSLEQKERAQIDALLDRGEQLEWSGKPTQTFLFRLRMCMLIFYLFCCYFCIAPLAAHSSFSWQLQAMAFVLGLLLLSMEKRYTRLRDSIFLVTNKRIMRFCANREAKLMKSIAYEDLKSVSCDAVSLFARSGWNDHKIIQFRGLADAKSVEKLILRNYDLAKGVPPHLAGMPDWKRWLKGRLPIVACLQSMVFCVIAANYAFTYQIFKPEYELFQPSGLVQGQKYPLIVGLTWDGNGDHFVELVGPAGEKNKAFIIGSNRASNMLHFDQWIPIVDRNIEEAMRKYPIDPARVYVSGQSGGAMSAYALTEWHDPRYKIRGLILDNGVPPFGVASVSDDAYPDDLPKNIHAVMLASPGHGRFLEMKKVRQDLQKQFGWKIDWREFADRRDYAPRKLYEEAVRLLLSGH